MDWKTIVLLIVTCCFAVFVVFAIIVRIALWVIGVIEKSVNEEERKRNVS